MKTCRNFNLFVSVINNIFKVWPTHCEREIQFITHDLYIETELVHWSLTEISGKVFILFIITTTIKSIGTNKTITCFRFNQQMSFLPLPYSEMIVNFVLSRSSSIFSPGVGWEVQPKGFGGIVKFSMLPSNIWTTLFIEGRSIGYHCMHQSAMIVSFFDIAASCSSIIRSPSSSPCCKRL